ncbi:hypothetical protein Mycsm_05227 [Mycobacterium sp. JS623]|uniref:hypothetical protein n=1 Tax=Mycobacterium sp. JS623 TaxID=212767 RepID=UPI0002A59813|nr:hypothetical protein [Mycobacterium sp. JS623]AGB25428.1 hypothetical protein Mycsm_05227 [Mycobacterium sp. JS623]
MATFNPFTDDPDKAQAFDAGYVDGFTDPDAPNPGPLNADLLDVYQQGFAEGAQDRDAAPTVPDQPDRFESAPDGTLIPIPSEAPAGHKILDSATVTVSPKRDSGYYVAIDNVPDDSHVGELVGELLTEVSLTKLEHLLIEGGAEIAPKVLKFGGLLIGC